MTVAVPTADEAEAIYGVHLAAIKLGFVAGAGRLSAAPPLPRPDGPSYETDGLRAVVVFERRPVALSEIQLFDWGRLAEHRGRTVDAAPAPSGGAYLQAALSKDVS